ncbi:peptidase M23-like protein [Anseongella ginsenosidimutans]|uniref:Peptidase M23-like protein n=1 Tax=Anseongella ginsenosidimutans TaxID=496056 RepID=A0A4R3KX06_9SPHI|nr:M23 family metallopeptidase [Anseongella ginsenosidimutans]QEC51009.1 M23 family metallopeptidase [Anseongella ginsenosidimutans]TCS90339.1 peptidase M23-like protein [Anseongella ginsenosidimutans]
MLLRLRWTLLLSPLLFSFLTASAQEPADSPDTLYPQDYFRLPLNLPVALSGTFGELRSNHFHTGLDFKTQQTTGHPVYAVADGYISRLAESAWGYGKAVYIDHPNGFTTVYGHLERFMPAAAAEMKRHQYEQETFSADLAFPPGKLPVKKGDIIAWSGNSGSSGGPHLHFEIRDTRSEEPINPLLFGFPVPDHVRPLIGGLFIYPLTDSSAVNGSGFRAGFSVTRTGESRYVIKPAQTITVRGRIGFGIIATDQLDGAANRNGNYAIELKRNGQTIYYSETDRLNFAHNRAMNSHIDYAAYLLDGRRIQKSHVSPGNPLTIYKRLSNNGSAWFSGTGTHEMEYIVSDVAGNRSILTFTLTSTPAGPVKKARPENPVAVFSYDRPNVYAAPGLRLSMEENTLYEDLAFTYSAKPAPEGAASLLHQVHDKNVPAHKSFDIAIKTNPGFTDTAKALIVNDRRQAFATTWENGWAKASVREFGDFYVSLDTIAPVIRPVNISRGKNMAGNSAIVLRISDDLSGVRSYRGTIDGKWVLMEHDGKTATLKHVFDERTPAKGGSAKHTFRLLVTDMKNNTAEYEAAFTR